ncbi:Hydroxypyruvate reductase [Pseudocercospora fuligena]|uniref:Hydroxypyruvate reductase n=1 Tax=Pseudocercospora fuligena TaxID=685502 RepID=A0A8H6RJH3_9PEZI|nr:Hydroxypyruvate reductase [Pseudocercospora fuligena]
MAPTRIDDTSLAGSEPHVANDTRPKAYLLDKYHPDAVRHAETLFRVVHPSDPEIQNWQQNAEYLLVKGSYITATQIRSAKRLKAIGKQGVGLDKIDLEACEKAGVKVFNTPGANATAVAELVLALTMAVARELGSIQTKQHEGLSVHKETCMGQGLTSKTLGLVGMGNISRAVAQMFHRAFDAKIVAYDPFLAKDAWQEIPHVRATSVEEVLHSSDIISIHVPSTKQTRDLIRLKELQMMKATANCNQRCSWRNHQRRRSDSGS